MAVYHKDVPAFIRQAADSVLQQALVPDELIIVIDGPIGESAEAVLGELAAETRVRIIRLAENVGAGPAREAGIAAARFDAIAIMDSDDISVPERFSRQFPLLASGSAEVVGGWVDEFSETPGDLGRVRRVPSSHEEVFRFGRWRQPINNVSAMFSRRAYYRAGGFRPVRHVEDYDLWVRMLMSGARFHNIQEVLVHARCGHGMLRRRRGASYLVAELKLFHRMYRSGYIGLFTWWGNSVVRMVSRFLPSHWLAYGYRRWLRSAQQ